MKPQRNSQDLAGCSQPAQIYKLKTRSSKVSDETSLDITKYLISNKDLPQESKCKTAVCIESPYKNLLTEVTGTNLNVSNEDDFAVPKCINKIQLNVCKPTKKHIKKCKQTSLTKMLREQSKTMEVNPDHLHLAIALTKSLQGNEDGECTNTQQRTRTIQENLQRFGFKYELNKHKVQNRRMSSENYKKKLKHIRPTLLLRTQTDREQIITDKVALLISQNIIPQRDIIHISLPISNKPASKYLQEMWDCNNKIFTMNCSLMDNSEMFYVLSLNINRCTTKCGSLLKNWSKIPGRELSPENKKKDQFEQLPGSPELFNSDDEIPLQKSFVGTQESMPNLVPPICISVSDESSDSTSLLDLTPKIKKVQSPKSNSFDKIKSDNWYKLSYLSEDDVIENENGICISESYTKENNHAPDNFISKNKSFKRNSNEFDDNSNHETELFNAEAQEQDFSSTLNITDYIYKMLDENKRGSTFILPSDSKFENLVHQNEMAVEEFKLSTNSNTTSFTDKNKKEISFKLDRHTSFNSTTSDDINLSQASQESIVISDEELNYSSIYSTPLNKKLSIIQTNFGTSNDEVDKKENERNRINYDTTLLHSTVTELPQDSLPTNILNNSKNSIVLGEVKVTPKNNIIVKTSNVTPVTNYDDMQTPKVTEELEKFGIKPLKRQRGIQMLKYIYESTHPVVNKGIEIHEESDDEIKKRIKRKKICLQNEEISMVKIGENQNIKIVGDLLNEGVSEVDMIFERKQSSKVASCRLPLHIAWHNLVSAQPDLQKNILLYEPLQLEVLYLNLKESGCKYHIQDLLTFLDKKCITVRTNNSSKPQHQKKLSRKKV